MRDDPAVRRATVPIAIIGLSCRLPGADDPDQFWTMLQAGRDAVGTVPPDRWDRDYFFHPNQSQSGKMYTRAGGFLENVDRFDAEFFGITPREAAQMDPQQRLALELAWEALESARIVPATIGGSQTSVVMGASSDDYGGLQREQGAWNDPYIMSGSAISLISNRISYIFDLHGASLTIDTACSSALVAVHQACEMLRRGESSLAIAGGVNIILLPWSGIGFSRARMLSPTGHCYAFDARADGYVRSEGGGVVVLKPLSAALADGDPIHAVIRASSVNSDGRTNGISLPSAAGQEQLLRRVYASAGIDPADVTYVEAHGTGTSAGDPVECSALGTVIGAAHDGNAPCLIGSVKTNIGHLESAAGIAGLTKVVLALKHREIPANIFSDNPNPNIPFADLNLEVVRSHRKLDEANSPLVMGVNSFGFGGTNAHVVLEEYVADRHEVVPSDSGPQSLLMSARTGAALADLAGRYAEMLKTSSASLASICHSAAVARTHHPVRIATFGASKGDVARQLAAYAQGDTDPAVISGQITDKPGRIAFVFSGNGSQWVGMGKDLIAREPLVAEWIGRVDDVLRPLLAWSVLDVLTREVAAAAYDRTEIAQPVLFALQVAIVEWLRAHGIADEACVGHSVGEVAAAYAAGILSLEQACFVVSHRSAVQAKTAGMGKMAAAALSAERAAAVISRYGDAVTIGAINSPGSVTLAGEESVLRTIGEEVSADGVFYRLLMLDYAFHSRAMDPVRDELLRRLEGLSPAVATRQFISTVTGAAAEGSALGAGYWWDNIRQPVRFAAAIEALITDGVNVFVEIGPHPVLTGYVNECLRAANNVSGVSVATLRRREPEAESLRSTLGAIYVAGGPIDYAQVAARVEPAPDLPRYPWQRDHYFLSRRLRMPSPSLGPLQHPLLGYRLPTDHPTWENNPELWHHAYLADHIVQGAIVFPAAAYIEMALAAGALQFGTDAIAIEDFEIRKPLVLSDREAPRIEFAFSTDDNSFRMTTSGAASSKPMTAATGRLRPLSGTAAPAGAGSVADLRRRLSGHQSAAAHYHACEEHGLSYGPAFQGLVDIWFGEGEALGRIVPPATIAGRTQDYHFHPALLDACFQVIFSAFPEEIDGRQRASYLPTSIDSV